MELGQVHIIHAMQDGTIREDLSGFVVPYHAQTAPAFHVLYEIAERIAREQTADDVSKMHKKSTS